MRFALSEDQAELRDAVRRFLTTKSPTERVRQVIGSRDGHDPAVWSQMADQLGLPGLALPEAYGGAGATPVELAVVLEEMGRAIAPSPFFATVVLAATAISASDDPAGHRDLLPPIASGRLRAALAWTEPGQAWQVDTPATRADPAGSGWTLTGRKNNVLDGEAAEAIVVLAATDGGPGLFLVDGAAQGLTREPLPVVDRTRPQADLELDGCPARMIGRDGGAAPVMAHTLDLAAVALAAEQAGGARRCLEMAVEYASERTQFARPIGSFQAVQHQCADMLLEVEAAWSAAYYAAWAAATDAADRSAAASLAQSYCSEAFVHAAAANVQIHGGIGFTWEHDAQLYLKRAKSSELLLGDPTHHRARLAERIGL